MAKKKQRTISLSAADKGHLRRIMKKVRAIKIQKLSRK